MFVIVIVIVFTIISSIKKPTRKSRRSSYVIDSVSLFGHVTYSLADAHCLQKNK